MPQALLTGEFQLVFLRADSEMTSESAVAVPYAFEDIYARYASSIERWVQRLGGPGIDAADAIQDVLIVVNNKCSSFREETGSLSTWIFRICFNVVRTHRRKKRAKDLFDKVLQRQQTSDSDVDDTLERRVQSDDSRRELYALLDKLSERDRTILVLFEIEHMRGESIAEILGVKVDTLWVLLHRARAKLFAEVKKAKEHEKRGKP